MSTESRPVENIHLDPLYLNEKMVLNCASFLFEGIPESTELTASDEKTKEVSAKVGIPKFLFSAEGGLKDAGKEQSRFLFRYTVGSLHSRVLNELRARDLLLDVATRADEIQYHNGKYIYAQAVLKPIDFFALLSALRTIAPIVSQVLSQFGDKIIGSFSKPGPTTALARSGSQPKPNHKLRELVEKTASSIGEVVAELEEDYYRSKLLEMVMYNSVTGVSYGIVDVDLSDDNPAEIRAKLTGGYYAIVGKLVRIAGEKEEMSLLQRSSLYSVVQLFSKLVAMNPDQEAVKSYFAGIEAASTLLEQFVDLSVKGPAIRIAAMSVSI